MVVLTGSAGRVGRRVLALLLTDPTVRRVRAVDVVAPAGAGAGERVEPRIVDLAGATPAELAAVLAGADALVHLAPLSAAATGRLLDAAAAAEVLQLVVLSSATAYGAWPNNPVPLTEEAPLRPNTDFAYAVERAGVEQLAAGWVEGGPDRAAAVLRPATALGEDGSSWLARALAAAAGIRVGDTDPPAQFLHLDDLAQAVDVARRARADGPLNVAPDGWVSGDAVRALAGRPPRLRLPERIATKLAAWSWRVQRGPIQPGLLPYTMHPWVVANDRLKALGWVPRSSNEEAFVSGTRGSWWTTVSPKRRQELSLAVAGLSLVGLVATVALLTRAVLRRRSRRR